MISVLYSDIIIHKLHIFLLILFNQTFKDNYLTCSKSNDKSIIFISIFIKLRQLVEFPDSPFQKMLILMAFGTILKICQMVDYTASVPYCDNLYFL